MTNKEAFDRFLERVKIKKGQFIGPDKEKTIQKKRKYYFIKCNKGHTWSARTDFLSKRWCKKCADLDSLKYDIIFCKKLAQDRGGECLSDVYLNVSKHLKWKCKKGHVWKSRLANNLDHWCKKCSYNNQYNKKDFDFLDLAKKIANDKGGKCSSTTFKNAHIKLSWICEKGHKWDASFHNVEFAKEWCPFCKKSVAQLKISNTLKEIFPEKRFEHFYNFRGFDWLRTGSNSGQEIDIFIKSKIDNFSLAVECNGEQHIKPVNFFGGADGFRNIQRLDELKRQKIKQHKNEIKYFIEIYYSSHRDVNEEKIRNILKDNKIC